MTATLTDNEKYLLKKIELLEKQIDKLEWRLLALELHSIEYNPSSISDEEAIELADEDNWLNDMVTLVDKARFQSEAQH